jgi:hypothetical protein
MQHIHIDMGWKASPTRAILSRLGTSLGGSQSYSSRFLISESRETLLARVRNGSAQESAKVCISLRLSSFVAGKGVGAGLLRKPERRGHEMMIWRA